MGPSGQGLGTYIIMFSSQVYWKVCNYVLARCTVLDITMLSSCGPWIKCTYPFCPHEPGNLELELTEVLK